MVDQVICSRCVMDSTIPEIQFDADGICNYCYSFDQIIREMPTGEAGEAYLQNIILHTKMKQKRRPYDVIVGVSGGVDSSFLIHYCLQKNLRVLAVNFDNGWHSEIAVTNIKNMLSKFKVDLYTYVVHYDEMKDILLSFMKAGIPWIDAPTDLAIISSLYMIAQKYHIRSIFVGNNIRTEGKQPTAWTYTDSRQIRYIQKKFGNKKIQTLPLYSPFHFLYSGIVKKIKMIRPLNYLSYSKSAAKEMLIREYGWKDYGGHHHESVFTRFAIGYWLPKKFGIDKRKITYSAQIRSGLFDRATALHLLSQPPYSLDKMEEDKNYIIKKLGIDDKKFIEIWNTPNKSINDYPSYLNYLMRYGSWLAPVAKSVFSFKPMLFSNVKKESKR